jgi:CRISPR-associated protein Csb2
MASRLRRALPAKSELIARVIVGRGASEADKSQRVRIVPLPSIGNVHVDQGIRRLLIEVPPNCPLTPADIEWAASGFDFGVDFDTGEVLRKDQPVLTLAEDRSILERFGVGRPGRVWRTVTAAALPQAATRRRIDPANFRKPEEWKGAAERSREERRAADAIFQALRHGGVSTRIAAMRVQREPFTMRGIRAEAFASGTRFSKERLWHAEIEFAEALSGLLLLGDGRYLGLGLMAPAVTGRRDVVCFALPADSHIASSDRGDLLRAVRRALMALARESDGTVPLLFSGHDKDGGPASSGDHRHIFLAGIGDNGGARVDRVIVAAPWAFGSVPPGRGDSTLFDRVVSSLAVVRAGRLGVIPFQVTSTDHGIVGPARCWQSLTAYRPTRHAGRGKDPTNALLLDVGAECSRRGLPRPEIELLKVSTGPRGGVAADLRLRFSVAVKGPILIGRDSHQGGGVFLARTRT